jgi:hypothetical protein
MKKSNSRSVLHVHNPICTIMTASLHQCSLKAFFVWVIRDRDTGLLFQLHRVDRKR